MDDQPNTTSRTRNGRGQYIRDAPTIQRDAEAARLRSRGKSYRQIAAELGIDVGTAHAAVQRAMAEVIAEPAAEAVAFSLRRLDEERDRLHDLRDRVAAILEREHVTVSQGRVVYGDDGAAVPDDEFTLKAVDRLLKIDEQLRRNDESRRRLEGLDQPAKQHVSGGLTYEVVGIDPAALR